MEVSPREDVPFAIHRLGTLYEHQGGLDGGGRPRLKYPAAMLKSVAHRAVNLRDAAQRISILHAATIAMRFADFALFEQSAEVRGGLDLSSMRARFLNALIEGDVGSLESITCHCADDVGGIDQILGRKQHQNADGQHRLRAINERHRFLRLEHQWLDLGALQGFGTRN